MNAISLKRRLSSSFIPAARLPTEPALCIVGPTGERGAMETRADGVRSVADGDKASRVAVLADLFPFKL